MSSEVKRYSMRGKFDQGLDLMTTREVVLVADYAALEAECERLRQDIKNAFNDDLKMATMKQQEQEIIALSAELAALKAASGEEVEVVAWLDPDNPDRIITAELKAYNESRPGAPSSAVQPYTVPLCDQRVTAALRSEVEQFKQANRELSESNVKRRDEWCKLRAELGSIRKQEEQVMGRVHHNPDHAEPVRAVLNSIGRQLPDNAKLYAAPPTAAMEGGMVRVPVELFGEICAHLGNIADFDPTYPKDTQPRNTSAELLLELRTILAHRQASQQEGE